MSAGGSTGMGKSESSTKQGSQQQSSGQSNSFIDPGQRAFLEQLWGTAQQQYPQMQGMARDFQNRSGELYSQGQGLLQQLGGATGGVIDQMGMDINRQLQRQLGGAGGIDSGFQQSGTFGGARNGIERGLAQEAALNQFGTQAANLRLQGNLASQSALPGLLGMQETGMTAQYGPLAALAAMIGNPAILNQSTQQGTGSSFGRSRANAWNFDAAMNAQVI